jgi:ribose-phosphate pyrophosphokinase
MEELKVFTGNANPTLAQAVAEYLTIPLGKCEVFEFSNENIFVRILENVRQRDVFVIQPLCSPVNKSLVELLIMLDAFKRASAERVTAVIPYYGYGRTDKKDQPRVPITGRLVADLLTVAGANRLLTVDLHAAQISKRARDLATKLNAPLAIMEKRRVGNTARTETLNVIGEVEGKIALTVDDEIDSAGSLVNTVTVLEERKVKEVYACCTHPIFSGQAIQRIAASPVKEVIVTDTVPVIGEKRLDKITILPIAPVLGEAIRRIHTGQSIGAMFGE